MQGGIFVISPYSKKRLKYEARTHRNSVSEK
ncbi:hypothetical protein SAMN06296427_103167 [Moheibacter sediminis]|uniref:Uncharacterized protein n=1 Tax=Moheibacter sediminis TaxID=1434700 RepID=A0A1W1ZRD4_9FLAO|nr:hypothetical protein SAMN06296427_103167 [Moheibacter sediminis]